MRLPQVDLRKIALYDPLDTSEDRYTWAPSHAVIRADVQPLGLVRDSENVHATIRGDTTSNTRLMLYSGKFRLRVGMGVCVDVGLNGPPDYRIVGVEPWFEHQRAYMEHIPENRRSVP